MKYLIRLITLPFVSGVLIIGLLYVFFLLLKNYISYGGEFITYTKEASPERIADIYKLIKKEYETKN